MQKLDHLFQPLSIGSMTLRNRTFMSRYRQESFAHLSYLVMFGDPPPGEYYDAADPLFRCVLIHQFRGHGTIVPTPGPLLDRSIISPVTFPH
jgi:hypothetical protein